MNCVFIWFYAISFLDQIVAVGYAIMTTRSPDLSWQMRAVRVLPMFLVPALAGLIYSTITRLTKMRKYMLIFVYMLWCRTHVDTSLGELHILVFLLEQK
jgi:hypothetical protein